MQKILSIHKVLATAVGLLVLVLMFLVMVDAGGRYFFNHPLKGGVEISRIVLSWLLYLSLAYALVRGAHVRVEVILVRLPRQPRWVLELVVLVLSLSFFGLATYGGWQLFWDSFIIDEGMAAPFWIPFWIVKLALPLGFALISIQVFINLVTHVAKLGKE